MVALKLPDVAHWALHPDARTSSCGQTRLDVTEIQMRAQLVCEDSGLTEIDLLSIFLIFQDLPCEDAQPTIDLAGFFVLTCAPVVSPSYNGLLHADEGRWLRGHLALEC